MQAGTERPTAIVEPVPPEYANCAHKGSTAVAATAVGLLVLFFFFGGLVLMYIGANRMMVGRPGQAPAWAIALLILGAILFLAFTIVGLMHPQLIAQLYMNRIMKRNFQRRPHPLVRWDDPRAELVDIIPKKNWRTMLQNDTDCGLLVLDNEHKELRFEGDLERYTIPANAIETCRVESWGDAITYYLVVCRIWRDGEVWELCLQPSCPSGIISLWAKNAAVSLWRRIYQLADRLPDPNQETPSPQSASATAPATVAEAGGQDTVRRFDKADVCVRLAPVPEQGRRLFATAAAERLFPAYRLYHKLTGLGRPEQLRQALDLLWQELSGQEVDKAPLQNTLEEVERMNDRQPRRDAAELPSAMARNAAAAVLFALRSRLSEQVEDAFWAGYQLYELATLVVCHSIDLDAPGLAAEQRVLAHPLVQDQIASLESDIDFLRKAQDISPNCAHSAAKLRRRAEAQGQELVDLIQGVLNRIAFEADTMRVIRGELEWRILKNYVLIHHEPGRWRFQIDQELPEVAPTMDDIRAGMARLETDPWPLGEWASFILAADWIDLEALQDSEEGDALLEQLNDAAAGGI